MNYLVTDCAAVSSACAQISVAFMHHLQCSLFNFYFHVLICPVSVSVEESGSSDSDLVLLSQQGQLLSTAYSPHSCGAACVPLWCSKLSELDEHQHALISYWHRSLSAAFL